MTKDFIKNNKWAIFFALLCGIIIVFPQFYFRYDPNVPYQGIDLHGTEEELFYFNRIREVQDGYFSLGCPILKTGKNLPYITPPLGEIITASLGKLLFLDFKNTILISRFFFTFIAFLLVYFFIFFLSEDKIISLTGAILVFLGRHFLAREGLIKLIQGKAPGGAFLQFFRPVHPQVSNLFFFGFLLFFWLFFIKKQYRFGIISLILLGSSFYVYPYLMIFLYTFCGILILIFIFQKNFEDLKRTAFVMLGGVFIAIPYLLNFYKFITHPLFSEITLRFALIKTHQPVLHPLAFLLFIVFLLFFSRKWKERYIFSLALLLTPIVVLNQQVITGNLNLNQHYHWYYHIPLALIFLTIIFFEKIREKNLIKFKNIIAFFIIGASFYNGILVQKASYESFKPVVTEEQRYGPIIDWLNKNAKKDEVVFATDNLPGLILSYTPLNVNYFYPFSFFYLCCPAEYISQNLFLYYRLDGLEAKDAKEVFLRDEGIFSRAVYGVYYVERNPASLYSVERTSTPLPQEKVDSFAKQYEEFLSIPLEKIWKEQEINYLIWDKKYHPQWNFDQYSFLTEIYEKDNIKIYRFAQ